MRRAWALRRARRYPSGRYCSPGGGLKDWRFSISHLSAARACEPLRGTAWVARGGAEMNNPAL